MAENKKLVYLSPNIYPGTPTLVAPEVRAQQNLAALRALGYEITVVTAADPAKRPAGGDRLVLIEPFPMRTFVRVQACWAYRRRVRQIVQRELSNPATVLLCDHWPALMCSPRHSRTVYSCHDLESNLMRWRRLRKNSGIKLRTHAYWWVADWLEWRLLGRAGRFISVSASEAEKIRVRLGLSGEYIPIVAPGPAPAHAVGVEKAAIRFWLYGASSTTSNKIMLDHLANGLFAQLQAAIPSAEFHQLGNYSSYDADKIDWLRQHFQLHGFVKDPAAFFRPGDFCLIPYEQDTGFRTKLPEACGYGMIAAGYPATFACCPEMRDGYNCVIGSSPAELVEKLAKVSANETLRQRLADGAFETRQRDFSFDALLERYRRALDF